MPPPSIGVMKGKLDVIEEGPARLKAGGMTGKKLVVSMSCSGIEEHLGNWLSVLSGH
jgi:hypothetical protein